MQGILIYTPALAPNITNLSPIPPPATTKMAHWVLNMTY